MKRPLALLVAALLIAGCTSLPRTGPVNSAQPQIPPGYGVDVLVEGPLPDAAPEEIVRGFLRAAAYGHRDDFSKASQYLADGVRWEPLTQVRIFSAESGLQVLPGSDGGIEATFEQVAVVDELGRYRQSRAGNTTSRFTLIRDANQQWRIASLEDGLLVSDVNFRQTFSVASLHFLTEDRSATVPELRWYPLQGRETHVVRGLLEGPSQWMGGGVITAFPEGTALGPAGVNVSDGSVTVDLTREFLTASPEDIALAEAQLEATLGAVGDLGAIELQVGGTVLKPPAFGVELTLPQSAPGPVVLSGTRLARLAGSTVQDIPGTPDLAERSPRTPAIPYEEVDAPRVVVADEGTSLLTVPDNGTDPVVLLTGTDLIAPSIDRYGWIWTASAGGANSLVAVRGDGTELRIGATWLTGRTLAEFRVAADGARAVVVSRSPTAVYVELVGISRDGLGRPRSLGVPLRVAEALVSVLDISWVDQTSLAVLGSQQPDGAARVYRVAIGGPVTILPAIEAAITVASNRNERSTVVATEDGYLYVRSGAGWRWVVTGVTDPVFSG